MEQPQKNTKLVNRFRFVEPPLYQVVMHNDDVTTMEFVVMVLCVVFNKSEADANDLMMQVHNNGMAIVGEYSLDIAESKVQRATAMAQKAKFPLRLTTQKKQ
ncbi:MAG: ATP-dependent Clp protease adaptor ClpS [Bacteroidales bacterium]|nr:ATP-dependent Clp protease adaptor ClpS [Bacteroidales bacterium]